MKTFSGITPPEAISAIIHWFHPNEHERHLVIHIVDETLDDAAVHRFVEEENKAVGKHWSGKWKQTKIEHDAIIDEGWVFIVIYVYHWIDF